jgi:hypothetical protein
LRVPFGIPLLLLLFHDAAAAVDVRSPQQMQQGAGNSVFVVY